MPEVKETRIGWKQFVTNLVTALCMAIPGIVGLYRSFDETAEKKADKSYELLKEFIEIQQKQVDKNTTTVHELDKAVDRITYFQEVIVPALHEMARREKEKASPEISRPPRPRPGTMRPPDAGGAKPDAPSLEDLLDDAEGATEDSLSEPPPQMMQQMPLPPSLDHAMKK